MLGVELVADKATRTPFPRAEKRVEAVFAKAFEQGLVTYPGGGCADGVNGDSFMISPPFVITDDECAALVAILDRTLTELGL
jgi:adenosylmethionine-8-amino-7-oxononanoate aminotransferase